MANPYLGEIKLVPYNFAPIGWHFCDGALLSIAQNTALFSLIGTTYGGDGRSTFALPDLRSRVAVHEGPNASMGELMGQEQVTLSGGQIPSHNHGLLVSTTLGAKTTPNGNYPATAPEGLGYVYEAYNSAAADTMNAGSVAPTGGNQPHSNLQPYLAINYVIAVQGVYPPRP